MEFQAKKNARKLCDQLMAIIFYSNYLCLTPGNLLVINLVVSSVRIHNRIVLGFLSCFLAEFLLY